MFCYIWLLPFVITSASGLSLWDSIVGGFANLIGVTSDMYNQTTTDDAILNINQLAHKYGYPLETHTVTTEDGYILYFHRMRSRENKGKGDKVVFLMHGIWESSDSWLLLGPGKALAYILADAGFDVWMGNARGNRHATFHTTLNTSTPEYWRFTWEEIGLYDLPAMIDYVLEVTGENSINYVGFSQGTTSCFVMNSMRPEYNEKIKLMFAMAPEVFLGNAKNILLKIFSPMQNYLNYFLSNFSVYSLSTDFLSRITPYFCSILPWGSCDNFFLSIVGPNNVNSALWPVILGHMPTGSSTLQFMHYGQLVNSRRFCRYDYGKKRNIEKYGQAVPPDYDLRKVTTPVILFYSGNDWFCDRNDVELLKNILPKVYSEYYIKEFAHADFMYADEAATLIYSHILQLISNGI